MFGTLALIFGAVLAAWAVLILFIAARNAFRERGPRLITCPENGCRAEVAVDAWKSGLASALGEDRRRLTACSRWPEKEGCDQACLEEIAESPNGCLVRSVVADWYLGRRCVSCGRDIGAFHAADRKPALRSPQGHAVALSEVRALDLDAVLARHEPLCANCYDAASFREHFPGLAVERPRPPSPR